VFRIFFFLGRAGEGAGGEGLSTNCYGAGVESVAFFLWTRRKMCVIKERRGAWESGQVAGPKKMVTRELEFVQKIKGKK